MAFENGGRFWRRDRQDALEMAKKWCRDYASPPPKAVVIEYEPGKLNWPEKVID